MHETEQPTVVVPSENTQAQELLARLERLPVLPSIGVMLGSGLLFVGIDVVAIAILAPTLLGVFHLTYAQVGALIGAVYIGQSIGAIFLGVLSARLGRKPLLLLSLASFGVLSVLAAFAPSYPALFVLRLAIGVPIACFVPIGTAYLSEYLPAAKRGVSSAAVFFFYTAGFMLAPFLLAFVLVPFSGPLAWRVLLGIGAFPLLLIPLAAKWLPESIRWLVHQQRIPEAEDCVKQLETRAARQRHGQRWAEPSVPSPPLKRMRLRELFSASFFPRTGLSWLRWFVAASGLVGFSSWLPTFYTLLGLRAFQVQLLTGAFGVLILLTLLLLTLTIDHWGRKRWFLIGFGLMCVGATTGGIAFGLLHSTSWVVLLVTGISLSIGGYVCVIDNFLSTAELFPTPLRTWALSTSKLVDALSSILAPTLIGVVVTTPLGIGGVFFSLALLSLLALVAEIRLGRETKLETLDRL